MVHSTLPRRATNHAWMSRIFRAKAAQTGGVVRRAIRDVEREVGLETLEAEIRRKGFHMLECGEQVIIICHDGRLRVRV